MTKPLIQIGNDVREMTDEEYADYLAHKENVKTQIEAAKEKQKIRAAVLTKLGLTADEAAALFG